MKLSMKVIGSKMDNNFNSENEPEKSAGIATFGKALLMFGITASIAFNFFSFNSPDGGEIMFWVKCMIYLIAPVGIFLILYARRKQVSKFVQEVKSSGLTKAMENIAREQRDLGGKIIADPLAEKTRWTPVRSAIVQVAMKLEMHGDNYVRISYRRWPFYISLLAASLFIAFISSPYWFFSLFDRPLPGGILGMMIKDLSPYVLVCGLVPIGFILMPFYPTYAETIIDIHKQILKQTRPWFSLRLPPLHAIRLDRSYALQLLGYNRSSDPGKAMGVCYEMNLVLKNAERIHLMNSDNCRELQFQAKKLAQSLGIPLWDKTHTIRDDYLIMLESLDEKPE